MINMEFWVIHCSFILLTVAILQYTSGLDVNIPAMCNDIETNETMTFIISNDITDWMQFSTNQVAQCNIKVNLKEMIKTSNTKLTLKVSMEPNVTTFPQEDCIFIVEFFPAKKSISNSFVPVKRLHCNETIKDLLIPLPPVSEFILEFVPDQRRNITSYPTFNVVMTVTPESCTDCYTMPYLRSSQYKNKIVTFPRHCGALGCLDYTASKYFLKSGYDILVDYPNLKITGNCDVDFSLMNPESVCIQVKHEMSEFYISIIHIQLHVLLDGKSYMYSHHGGHLENLVIATPLEQYWCLPKHWFHSKSILTIRWLNVRSKYDFILHPGWNIYISTNSSISRWNSVCPKDIYYRTTTRRPYTTSELTRWTDSNGKSDTDSIVLGPVVGIVSFAAFVIGVCCFAAYVRSKSQTRRQHRRQPVQTYLSNTRETGQAIDLTSFYTGHTASPPNNNYRPAEMDLPPPYPGKSEPDIPPPSYEESCATILANNANNK